MKTNYTRRKFLQIGTTTLTTLGMGTVPLITTIRGDGISNDSNWTRIDSGKRTWNLSISLSMYMKDPSLADEWQNAGITDLWPSIYHPGIYTFPWNILDEQSRKLKDKGFRVHWIGLPLGHPKSVIRKDGKIINADDHGGLPSGYGKPAIHFSGKENWGVSLHSPMDKINAKFMREIEAHYGACDLFLDDDFRLEANPYGLGGCICPECKAEFLKYSGLPESRWEEVLNDLKQNRFTPLLRYWVDFLCNKLTDCFRLMQKAAPKIDLGIMIMYLGMERAGIRLDDYRNTLFRVGEMMFGDNMFDQLKYKMDELYSVLIHRRFAAPGRAFSETTMYPAKTLALSKENMAAKLTISTITDVRNTIFMTGDAPIPAEYWRYFKDRIGHESRIHEQTAGAKPVGPFKHYWGIDGRYLTTKGPYSLFLATGVPFEVCNQLPKDGWTFLGDEDADAIDRGDLLSPGSVCLARKTSPSKRYQKLNEEMEDLFRFRKPLLPSFQEKGIPYIEEETPVVLAWYPERGKVILWNVEKVEKLFHLRIGTTVKPVKAGPLQSVLVSLN